MKRFRPNLITARLGKATIAMFGCVVMAVCCASAIGQTRDGIDLESKTEPTSETTEINLLQRLVIDAGSAQADSDYQRAAELWEKVLEQDVTPVVKSKAHFNAGLCYSQLRDFGPSIDHFKRGLEIATAESAADVPQALFYLGYGQLELGRSLQVDASDELSAIDANEKRQRAMQLLTTSAQTLGRLQRRYPTFEGNDQAAFFQGKSFQSLGRLDEAKKSFETGLAFDQPAFAIDAQFALADTLEKLGQPNEALSNYLALIEKTDDFSDQQKPLLSESQFRAAEVLMKLGDSHKVAGDLQSAATEFSKAYDLYHAVANQDENVQLIPLAIYGAAWSKMNLAVEADGSKPANEAAAWFRRLAADFPNHELASDAEKGLASARELALQLTDSGTGSDNKAVVIDAKPEQEEVQFELGLAYVKEQDWDDAIGVFSKLIENFPQSKSIDRYRYELAWALRSTVPPQPQKALKQFATIIESTPNSSFVAEAHFHVGTAAYDLGDYKIAAENLTVVLQSELPGKVLERAMYQLAWTEYRRENFADAAEIFERQLAEYPLGQLATDAKVMFAESQFRQDKHSDALEAYLVAKPAVNAAGNIDPKMQMLTALHGAQSANESQQYDEAIRFATPVTTSTADEAYQADAWLEIGIAQAAKGNQSAAIEAWQKAVPSMSMTGARARCLLGEAMAQQEKYQEALNQFKLVYFGFGGVEAEENVRPWQAYALYEAARLNQTLCRDATGPVLKQRIEEAIGQYERLVEHYGDNDLAAEAKRQIVKLEEL